MLASNMNMGVWLIKMMMMRIIIIIIIIIIIDNCITNGGWVPETSRSFHYWQPVPRWRLLPWLANPGNSAMSSHPGEGNKHPSQWKKGGKVGKNCLDNELPF